MDNDQFHLKSDVISEKARIVMMEGAEGLSKLYEFNLTFLVPADEEHTMLEAVNTKATLVIATTDPDTPFQFHGILSKVSLLHVHKGYAIYRVRLSPKFWLLTQTMHSRVFVDKNIPDIIDEVMESAGFSSEDYELKTSGTYDPYLHICQYRESSFDFLSRRMENDGLYYFFEQGEGQEKLIITDDLSYHEDLVPDAIRYHALGGHNTVPNSLSNFRCVSQIVPAEVQLRDYDELKPSLDVSGKATISDKGKGDIVLHSEHFLTPGAGKRLAQIRAEEYLCREVMYQARGSANYLRPGYTFSLEEHPYDSFNKSYLTVQVRHSGAHTAHVDHHLLDLISDGTFHEGYHCDLEVIESTVQYRALRSTPIPRISGMVSGIIDGEADSQYAQLDDHGRYLVIIQFDESGLKDGKASTRLRMLQPHGGSVEAFHFPLRKGTEVLLIFLGGDPDRPMIGAVAPNAHKQSPVTVNNYTMNIIMTGGSNRLEMDDKDGSQWIKLSCPVEETFLYMGTPDAGKKNLVLSTKGDSLFHTGRDCDVTIDGHFREETGKTKTTTVHGDNTEIYEGIHKTTVTGDVTQTYKANETIEVTGNHKRSVNGAVVQEFKATHDITTTGSTNRTVVGAVIDNLVAGLSSIWGKDNVVNKGITATCTLGITSDTFIGLKNSNFVGGSVSVTVGATSAIFIGAQVNAQLSAKMDMTMGASLSLKASVDATFKLSAELLIAGGISLSVWQGLKIGIAGGPSINLAAANIFTQPLKLTVSGGPDLNQTAIRLRNAGLNVITLFSEQQSRQVLEGFILIRNKPFSIGRQVLSKWRGAHDHRFREKLGLK
jgi:type VI secretion system secreted protein VgrG